LDNGIGVRRFVRDLGSRLHRCAGLAAALIACVNKTIDFAESRAQRSLIAAGNCLIRRRGLTVRTTLHRLYKKY
jgi:hypothetical protein